MTGQQRVRAYLDARRRKQYPGNLIHRVWSNMEGVELTENDLAELLDDNEDQRRFIDRAYRDRAQAIALLAAVFPSCWHYSDPDNAEWPVVFVDTPEGQCSWHIAPQDWDLFAHVRYDPRVQWDRHTTEEKYGRMQRLCAGYIHLVQNRPVAQFAGVDGG